MLKLKAGNVFEKLNNMDRKQAYTIGAIGAVVLVALLMLASLLGKGADDSSLDDYKARGYDLASMPFLNDEAEEFLLSSKYPDMQENGSSLLFSAQEKEERQAADAEEEEDEEDDEDLDEDESSGGSGVGIGYKGRGGGSGRGGRGGGSGRGATAVGRLGNATMGRSSGSGMSGGFGAPRGDYSPYKTDKKGSERPIGEFKNEDARRALAQFAQASRATAGLRDGKLANAKRALQSADIRGSEAFTDGGIDLSKANGLAIDTNAPTSTPDLSNLQDKINDAAKEAQAKKEKDDKKDKTFAEKLLTALGDAVINSVAQGVGSMISSGFNHLTANIDGAFAKNDAYKVAGDAARGDWIPTETQTKIYGKGENGQPPAAWTSAHNAMAGKHWYQSSQWVLRNNEIVSSYANTQRDVAKTTALGATNTSNSTCHNGTKSVWDSANQEWKTISC